jgi:hypothetical protein
MTSKWVHVENELPSYHQEVLVLIEQRPFDYVADEKETLMYYYTVARLQPQYLTEKPFWIAAWDHEAIETAYQVVTHWQALPWPPQKVKANE